MTVVIGQVSGPDEACNVLATLRFLWFLDTRHLSYQHCTMGWEDHMTLVTGNPFTYVARSLGQTPMADRAVILNRIADRIMQNLGTTRQPRTWDSAKPLRQTLAADIPPADRLSYLADDFVCRRARSPRSTTTPRLALP